MEIEPELPASFLVNMEVNAIPVGPATDAPISYVAAVGVPDIVIVGIVYDGSIVGKRISSRTCTIDLAFQ